MTNAPTDHGQPLPTMSRVAEATAGVVEVTADKGCQSAADMAACLQAGALPHVIADDGVDAYEMELPHEPTEDADPSSTDPAEISRRPRAGVVPDACAGAVANAEVREVRRRVVDEEPESGEPYGAPGVVVVSLAPDVRRTPPRMGISEHPFGTIKCAMGCDHFLLRGLAKVEAEFSLMCLGYNITHAANLLGFGRLMELMGGAASYALSWLGCITGKYGWAWHPAAARRRRVPLPAGI
ncbi:MAG: transposase [Atopobiaceae bacterium]|nr:transposase [Atopobiaceae bacterium]